MSTIYENDKRFVLINNNLEVTILDTEPEVEEGNMELFGVECANEYDAKYLTEELYGVVRFLNQQHEDLSRKD